MTAPSTQPATNPERWPASPYTTEPAAAALLAQALHPQVLCAFHYEGDCSGAADPRRLRIPLRQLAGSGGGELWLSRLPVEYGWDGEFGYSHNGEILILQLRLEEKDLSSLDDAVCRAYCRIGAYVAERGYPQVWRAWNYLSGINEGEGDAERYRQFCVGRYRALDHHPGFETHLPAASAIGSRSGGMTLLVVAGKYRALQVENPRQVSAFRYPRAYGPRSPSFSRAALLPWADGARLLVSGTASIVGHATAHAGDTLAQLQQTAGNLETLLAHSTQMHLPGYGPHAFKPESYTVYLRHEEDLAQVQPELQSLFGGAPLQVLAGDICRRELLIEVEGAYRIRATDAAA